MDIFIWLEVMAVFTALLLLLLFMRLLTGRLILPARAYAVLSFAGFAAYVVFLSGSGHGSGPSDGFFNVIWLIWLAYTPLLLPLISGLLGWAALRSFWRWVFLGVGFGLILLPLGAGLVFHFTGGR